MVEDRGWERELMRLDKAKLPMDVLLITERKSSFEERKDGFRDRIFRGCSCLARFVDLRSSAVFF